MITRAQWGARAPKEIVNLTIPVPEFFVHHTDTWECFNVKNCSAAVRSIQKFHMDDRGWDDIGYNFLVGEDGNVYEGRGWDHLGTHTKGFNSKSLGTSVIGNYTAKLPNEKALTALKALIACGVEQKKLYPDFRMYGHRDAGKTECPGDALYKLIQTWPHYSHKPPKTVLV
ncbi:peptidoglycan recognition protein 1-like [Mercenaria mercenaria]|uniref:peptidoglycan recognition protein 1-like n=1 Tax=Mercenaria mercenaria TaxID=6596 RepID=UPI00234F1723|nr:peptidoglycan recognition protein 1-like [Mercenaria mercenaria]